MQIDLGYTDPLLVSTYDAENGGREDIDFYLALAEELGSSRVIDLGCGTGVLASDLAANGLDVVGVDPASAMLDVARSRPGGDRVTWLFGDADQFESASADLVVMTGHAAQVLINDDSWNAMLHNAYRALEPGGHLAFETRNPQYRAWESWTEERSRGTFRLPDGASFESWVQVTEVAGELVTFDAHTVFAVSGDHRKSISTLRFRSEPDVRQGLAQAGFDVVEVFGDWQRQPVRPDSVELIFLARKP